MSVRKPFNQKLFDENDPIARKAAIAFLSKSGIDVRENRHIYGVDLIASKDGVEFYVEVERRSKKCWPTGDFPFATIHIPLRKEKYKDKVFAYVSFSHDLTRLAWLAPEKVRAHLKEGVTKEVPNCYVPSGEEFFDIPKEQWQFFDLS